MNINTSSATLSKVCAVVDCQGFTVRGTFFPRELAVSAANYEFVAEFDVELYGHNLRRHEKRTIVHQINYIHGLGLVASKGCRSYREFSVVIKAIYDSLATDEKPYFACKNNSLAYALRAVNIPFVDLTTGFEAPTMPQLDKRFQGFWQCPLHVWTEPSKRPITCACRKSSYLWQWVLLENENNKTSIDVVNELDYELEFEPEPMEWNMS
jgi:hypothetical protein